MWLGLASKGKRELEKGDGCSPAGPEAMRHDVDIRVSPAEFSVDYDKANRPVCYGGKYSEQY